MSDKQNICSRLAVIVSVFGALDSHHSILYNASQPLAYAYMNIAIVCVCVSERLVHIAFSIGGTM